MKIRFLGAVGTVAGSCTLLEHQGEYFLVDCGAGLDSVADATTPLDFNPARLRSVFLTHAHLDHCGLLPALIARGFRGRINCTAATRDLTLNALDDSVTLGQCDKAHVPLPAQFCCPDEHPEFKWGQYVGATNGLTYSFARTSHVLGSVSISFQFEDPTSKTGRTTICFSGDVGCNEAENCHQALLAKRYSPDSYANYLVLESTYGGRDRPTDSSSFDVRIRALASMCERALALGPQPLILIPCFTLHRTQELLADLHAMVNRHLDAGTKADWLARLGRSSTADNPLIDLAIESALAWKHTAVYRRELPRVLSRGKRKPLYLNSEFQARACVDGENPPTVVENLFKEPLLRPNRLGDLRIGKVGDKLEPGAIRIVIAGSGMCQGGRIIEHLKAGLGRKDVLVVLMGFQGLGTPGAELRKRVDDPHAAIDLTAWGLPGEVSATVMDLGRFYSGHADQSSLIRFALEKDSPTHHFSSLRRIFLNHGDNDARRSLREALVKWAADNPDRSRPLEGVELPDRTSGWFDLTTNRWTDGCEVGMDGLEGVVTVLLKKLARLEAEVAELRSTRR